MKRLKNKKTLSIITNVLLSAVLITVFTVSFYPQTSMTIYGGNGAIYSGDGEGGKVSLMFNVYENADVVEGIIKTLKDHNAKATFFVGGCWADDNEKTVKLIVDSGNEIANHGYFHKDHKTLGYEDNKQEIRLTEVIVSAFCGVKTTLFAPPSGSFSDTTVNVCRDMGYKLIMWSKDTIDWRDSDVEKLYKRATDNLKSGDFILMHPKKHTLSVLSRVLDYIESNGLRAVSVSENLTV